MSEPTAVIYDLDGTLVRLAVDWDAATVDARSVFREAGIATRGGLWELLERAPHHGLATAVEEAVAVHERAGARGSVRLPTADELAAENRPIGVCSLNCEEACRIALHVHGLDEHVGAIVGRDTVAERKPHPAPLLAAVQALGAEPADALFVGDTARDAATADRAGVAFAYADEGASRE